MKNTARMIKKIYDEAGSEGFTRGNGCFGLTLKELSFLADNGYVIDGDGVSLMLSHKAISVIDRQIKAED